MFVALKGSSAVSVTAGILLLSRARSFGLPLEVEIVGDPKEITPVLGPALVHSPVLASCGVGRDHGAGALVVVPGPPSDPIAVSTAEHGVGEWFWVDRSGKGHDPATRAFTRLSRSRQPRARELGKLLRQAMGALGIGSEPAVLDMLFGAPDPPLIRTAAALRAGRTMNPSATQPITRFFSMQPEELPEPLVTPVTREVLLAARKDGQLDTILDRFNVRARDELEHWLEGMFEVMAETEDYDDLITALSELTSHLASMSVFGLVPPLDAHLDAVAVGLGTALGATAPGPVDANRLLSELFVYLGGRFTDAARYPVSLEGEPPPDDRLARWSWLCRATRQAADAADSLWKQVVDPPQ